MMFRFKNKSHIHFGCHTRGRAFCIRLRRLWYIRLRQINERIKIAFEINNNLRQCVPQLLRAQNSRYTTVLFSKKCSAFCCSRNENISSFPPIGHTIKSTSFIIVDQLEHFAVVIFTLIHPYQLWLHDDWHNTFTLCAESIRSWPFKANHRMWLCGL